jgi:cysteine desulfurase
MAHSSLRLGIGRFTTEAEIDLAVDLLEKHVNRCVIRCCTLLHGMVLRSMRVSRLREMSPLWEMVQEGIDLKSIQWSQDSGHHH